MVQAMVVPVRAAEAQAIVAGSRSAEAGKGPAFAALLREQMLPGAPASAVPGKSGLPRGGGDDPSKRDAGIFDAAAQSQAALSKMQPDARRTFPGNLSVPKPTAQAAAPKPGTLPVSAATGAGSASVSISVSREAGMQMPPLDEKETDDSAVGSAAPDCGAAANAKDPASCASTAVLGKADALPGQNAERPPAAAVPRASSGSESASAASARRHAGPPAPAGVRRPDPAAARWSQVSGGVRQETAGVAPPPADVFGKPAVTPDGNSAAPEFCAAPAPSSGPGGTSPHPVAAKVQSSFMTSSGTTEAQPGGAKETPAPHTTQPGGRTDGSTQDTPRGLPDERKAAIPSRPDVAFPRSVSAACVPVAHVPAVHANSSAMPAAPPSASVAAPHALASVQPILGATGPVATHGSSVSPAAVRSAPGTAATFERMDGAAEPQVIERTPQRLAVGVRDPALGWVEIRTRAAGGQIGAVMATASPGAHQALAPALPAIRDYLASQQVRVDHLAAEFFSPSASGGGSHGTGHAAGNQPESGSAHEQRGVERGQQDPGSALDGIPGEAYEEQESIISVRV
jgi:flagellar hook-length control protein FliK